jgi:drug/metabolite transporter (DMT)-like permease
MVTEPVATEHRNLLPSLAMAAVIIAWGLGPPVSKLISAPPLVAVFARMWLSVPVLYAVAAGHNGHRPTLASLRLAAPAGALFGINLCFVFATFHHASIAVLSVMAALQPGLVLLVAGRLLGERPTRWHVAWTVVGIFGTSLVILGAGDAVETSWLGVLFATLALLTFTGFFVATKLARMNHQVDAISWLADLTLVSAITVTPLTLIGADRDDFAQLAGIDWFWLAFIVLVTGILGHGLMSWVHGFIDASRSSLYVLSMNVVAVGAAWPIHDEPLTLVQLAGGLVVLGAVAAVVSRPPERLHDALDPVPAPVPAGSGAGGFAGDPAPNAAHTTAVSRGERASTAVVDGALPSTAPAVGD